MPIKTKTPKTKNYKKWLLGAVLVLLASFIIWGILDYSSSPKHTKPAYTGSSYETVCLKLQNDCDVTMEVADDMQKQAKGLSGRQEMADNQGMIFAFEQPETQCFWMKEMRFSLDLIWLDSDKKVVMINKNLSPESYPENYCSKEPIEYVIEVNSGVADKLGISEGKTLTF